MASPAIGRSPAGEKVSITYVIATSSPSWRTNVCHPELIASRGFELTVHRIGRRRARLVPYGGAYEALRRQAMHRAARINRATLRKLG
jgi:hypothetical protein